MTRALPADEHAAATACIAEICTALQSAGLAEDKMRLAAARDHIRTLDARLQQIQGTLDRMEVQLATVELELAELIRPSRPF